MITELDWAQKKLKVAWFAWQLPQTSKHFIVKYVMSLLFKLFFAHAEKYANVVKNKCFPVHKFEYRHLLFGQKKHRLSSEFYHGAKAGTSTSNIITQREKETTVEVP